MFGKNIILLFLFVLFLLPGCMVNVQSPKNEYVRTMLTSGEKPLPEMEKLAREKVLQPMASFPGLRHVLKTSTRGNTEIIFELKGTKRPGEISKRCIQKLEIISGTMPEGTVLTIIRNGR